MTAVPLVHWTARGGMPVSLTLYNDSEGDHDSELAYQWTHSFDLWGTNVLLTSGYMIFQMPDDSQLTFDQNMDGSWATEPIYHNSLTYNSTDGSFTVITKNQVAYHFVYLSGDTSTLYCSTITDANGNVITLAYTTGRYVSTVTDPTGRALTFAYADSSNPGKISSITDCNSHTWTMTYDTDDDLLSVTLPTLGDGNVYKTQFTYGSDYHLASLTPPRGFATAAPNAYSQTFSYNTDGSTAWVKDALGNQTSFSYTSGSGVTAYTNVTDANANITTYTYHAGYMIQALDPLGKHTDLTWDYVNDNLTQVTDKRGYAWTWGSFDSDGNPGWSKDPYLNQTTYTWLNHYEPLVIRDPLYSSTDSNTYNHSTTFAYDTTHYNLTSVKDGLGHTTTYTYDTGGHGLLTQVMDALSHSTTLSNFDTNGHPQTVTDANYNATTYQNETTYTYNALGNVMQENRPAGNSVTYVYDNWERRGMLTANPSGGTGSVNVGYLYDADNNLTKFTDGNGNITTYAYDDGDRLTSVTRNAAHSYGGTTSDIVAYTYDGSSQKGLLSSKSDGNGHSTSYLYTVREELQKITYADSNTDQYTYDDGGNQASHTDANGSLTTYAYYHDNLLQTIAYPTGGGISANTGFVYDNARRQTSMTDATGTTGYSYDSTDRLTQIASPNGGSGTNYVNYTYDNANRRSTMFVGATATSSNTYTYGYDPGDRLTSILNPSSETTAFSYTLSNKLATQTYSSGAVATYSYDTHDRLQRVKHTTTASAVLADYQYAYDAADNIHSRTDMSGNITTFSYDQANQLTHEVQVNGATTLSDLAYAYDHNGNRVSKTDNVTSANSAAYAYVSNTDRLHTATYSGQTKTYGYDNNGNCVSLVSSAGLAYRETDLTYDVENRATGVSFLPTGFGATSDTMTYNGLNLRTRKVDTAGTFNYITDGSSPASDVLQDGAATYTPGISEKRGTTSKFYHGDTIGSTGALTNSSQTSADTLTYDAWGNATQTGSSVVPFGYGGGQGYQSDTDSGLKLLGNRYYDSDSGRFLSADPAQSGDNWYAYADNNPVRHTDPSGLTPGGDSGSSDMQEAPKPDPTPKKQEPYGPPAPKTDPPKPTGSSATPAPPDKPSDGKGGTPTPPPPPGAAKPPEPSGPIPSKIPGPPKKPFSGTVNSGGATFEGGYDPITGNYGVRERFGHIVLQYGKNGKVIGFGIGYDDGRLYVGGGQTYGPGGDFYVQMGYRLFGW